MFFLIIINNNLCYNSYLFLIYYFLCCTVCHSMLIINAKKEIVNLEIETDILIYHKPTGEICSSKGTNSNKSVFESIPKRTLGKWIMVGRLDVNTSGLLIFSYKFYPSIFHLFLSNTLEPNQKSLRHIKKS